jgi:hypothetical protein
MRGCKKLFRTSQQTRIALKCLTKAWQAVLMLTFALPAYADNPNNANCPDNNRVNQSFSFSKLENPDIEILDFFYGIPNCPSIYNPDQFKKRGKSMQGFDTYGPMRRAQKLYVKWRIQSTGQELEDTVDLTGRLPSDMTNHRLHFMVRGTQLFVFLVTPEFRQPDTSPDDGPKAYTAWHKTITIYPDQLK